MRVKKENKGIIARECWTHRWQKEQCLPQVVYINIVLFSHQMPFHTKRGPPPTHVIPNASIIVALENLEATSAIVNPDIDDYGED